MDKEYFLSQYVNLKLLNEFKNSDENILKLKEYILSKAQGGSVILHNGDDIFSLIFSIYFLRNVVRDIIFKNGDEYFLIYNNVLNELEINNFVDSKLFNLTTEFKFIDNKKNKEINIDLLWNESNGKTLQSKFNDYLDRLKREAVSGDDIYFYGCNDSLVALLTFVIFLGSYKNIYFKKNKEEKEYTLITK